MKKTWIIILVLAMMMTVVLATACGEEESPAPETPEPIAAQPADGDDEEMQKGGSGLFDGFELEGADFKATGELGEADDAQFKINPNNIESARP